MCKFISISLRSEFNNNHKKDEMKKIEEKKLQFIEYFGCSTRRFT